MKMAQKYIRLFIFNGLRLALFLIALSSVSDVRGQRSFTLEQDRNYWLTSSSPAALTSFSVPSISSGSLFYAYENGDAFKPLQGSKNNIFGARVRSYTRLSDKVVVYGNISYSNNSVSEMAVSMLIPTDELIPFDLKEESSENKGNKRFEYFNLEGKTGWKLTRLLSLGAGIDYSTGSYAKFRDLRHTNTLMDLDVSGNVFLTITNSFNLGAGFEYRRRTETLKFDTFGTTDKVFRTIIDYANGYGPVETYGGEGFTDSTHELPLFSDYLGLNVQASFKNLFFDWTYLRRNGYYGRKSQYTALHSTHSGNFFKWNFRCYLKRNPSSLIMIDLKAHSELLRTFRTNYRKVTASINNSVTYYEYYRPVKMSDKAQQTSSLSMTACWKPAADIFLWNVIVGADFLMGKQTAYIFPDAFTKRLNAIRPYAEVERNKMFQNTSVLRCGVKSSMQLNYLQYWEAGASISYEFSIRKNVLRPVAGIEYIYFRGYDDISALSRNNITIKLGVQF